MAISYMEVKYFKTSCGLVCVSVCVVYGVCTCGVCMWYMYVWYICVVCTCDQAEGSGALSHFKASLGHLIPVWKNKTARDDGT